MNTDLEDFFDWTFIKIPREEEEVRNVQNVCSNAERETKNNENPIYNTTETKSERPQVRIKTFPCDECDKVWNQPWELKRHKRTHARAPTKQETERDFECTDYCKNLITCKKKFKFKKDLNKHMRLHTGDNLLVCGVCQKKFTSKYAILHHVAVHTGEKPFQCAVCEKQFTQPANLRTHVKKKHCNSLNNQNRCDYCGSMLSSITSLHQHLLDIHKGHVEKGRVISDNMKMKMEPKFTASDVFIQKESVINLNPFLKTDY